MSYGKTNVSDSTTEASFFLKHEFAIRRIHSLTGIIPLGLYMFVHLATNASLLNGTQTFQRAVFLIHSPGKFLPLIEWAFIFLPLLFHALIGVWIATTGRSNVTSYNFSGNRRYAFQRWTGIIALVYLFFHILHLHGWFHADVWLKLVEPLGFAQFRPYNAASTLVEAMGGFVWPAFYLIGMLACVYHLANGLWTAGITWGLWITPKSQQRATQLCTAIGIVIAVLGTSAWWAAVRPQDVAEMRKIEDQMYATSIDAGIVIPDDHKRSAEHEEAPVAADE